MPATLSDADIDKASAPQTLTDADVDKASQTPSIGDHVSAFFKGLGTAPILHPIDMLKQAAGMAAHPQQAAESVVQGFDTGQQRAQASWEKGQYVPAVIHSGLSMIPFLGPAIDEHYQAMKDAEAKGDTVGMTEAAGKLIGLGASGELARRAPEIAGAATDAAASVAPIVKAAAKAGGSDIAVGAGKMAAGASAPAVLSHLPGGTEIGAAAGFPTVSEGARQLASGVKSAWAAGKEAGVAAKLQRAADSQSASIRRLTDAFDPATAEPTMQLSSPVGPKEPAGVAPMQPMDMPTPAKGPSDAPLPEPQPNTQQLPLKPGSGVQPNNSVPEAKTVTRPEAMNPQIARNLDVGDKMVNPDGSTMILQKVPLDNVDPEPGNQMYDKKVAEYQANGYDVAPELRVKDDGRFQVFEGHHRITADARNGASEITAWVPEKPEVQTIPFSKPDQPPEFYQAKARAAKAPDEQKLAEYMSQGGITAGDTRQMTDAQWEQAARAAGVKQPTPGGQDRIRFHLNRLATPQASPNLINRLQDTGSMSVAEQLRQAMSQ